MAMAGRRTWLAAMGASVLVLMLVSATAPAGVPDTLQQRVAACTSCHGKQGQGGDNGFNPRLAGKPALYLYHQLLNFREGRRHYPMMQHMVKGLPDAYLHEIADYFATLDTPWPAPAASHYPASVLHQGRALAEHGDPARKIPACSDCHGKRLMGLEPAIPPLLGLPRDYISNQLGAWRTGTRHAMAPDCMAKVAKRLTPQEVAAVAEWLSSQAAPADTRPAPAGSLKLPWKCGGVEE